MVRHEAKCPQRRVAMFDVMAELEPFLYATSHNTLLFEQATSSQRKLHAYRRPPLRARNRSQHSFEERQAVAGALRDGNADKARQAIRVHVVVQGERCGDLIASLSHMSPGPAAG